LRKVRPLIHEIFRNKLTSSKNSNLVLRNGRPQT